jgi:sialic acid synthase SpsE
MKEFFKSLKKPYLIAECGINHNGSLATAKRMIQEAKKAGADAVKFQYFQKDRLINPYVEDATGVIKILSKYFMTEKFAREVKLHSDKVGMTCFFTPFDVDAVDVLEKLGMELYKIASGDIVNPLLQERVCRTGKPVILSTGAATLEETDQAVRFMRKRARDLALLHCVSLYPAKTEEMNLLTISFLAKRFGTIVGLSDHSMDDAASVVSIALGGMIVEKHFTLDKKMSGPDHRLSANPAEFALLRKRLDSVFAGLGHAGKHPLHQELKGHEWGRRSIVVLRDVKKGERIQSADLDLLRPRRGLGSEAWFHVVGQRAKRDLRRGEWIRKGDF